MWWRWLNESAPEADESGAEGTVGEEEDGLKWAAREERRLKADDILGVDWDWDWP
jgi:hypothetical protein